VALSGARAFSTPLGLVEVAQDINAGLLRECACCRIDDFAHDPEHCLEAQLPFLQRHLGSFRIVPILVVPAAESALAAALVDRIRDDPLAVIVASSDLSHGFSATDARQLDESYLASMVGGELGPVRAGQACGRSAAAVLSIVAATLGWQPRLLAYANSGDTTGDRVSVVGYGAVAFEAPAEVMGSRQ
jgi:AmmeMemoRadiSam system protein B